MLRFRFDCGPADNIGYDSVQIANLDIVTTEDGGGRAGRGIKG